MKISLTRTDCLALAVAKAVVAHHLKLEGVHFAQTMDLINKGDGNRVVEIRTPEFHASSSQKFVVKVGFTPDEEYEYDAELHQSGKLIKRFWWDFCGSRVDLTENSDL